MTVALRGLNDDRYIVTKCRKDPDQARSRIAVNIAAQDSKDVRLTDAGPGGISADDGDDVDLPQTLRFDDSTDDAHQIELDSSFRRIGVAAIFQEIAAAADRRRILEWIFPPILATRILTHRPFSSANSSRRALRLS